VLFRSNTSTKGGDDSISQQKRMHEIFAATRSYSILPFALLLDFVLRCKMARKNMRFPIILLSLLCVLAPGSAFVSPQQSSFVVLSSQTTNSRLWGENNNNDFPDNTEYKGDVDWDAEWKKVVNDKTTKTRPGSDFYKTDAEITLTKTVNKVAEKVTEARSQIDLPDMRWNSLKGDWRFWLAILVILSVGTSILNGAAMSQTYSPDSYYI